MSDKRTAEFDKERRAISMKLSARPDGRFAKVIDGRYVYFGRDGNRAGAEDELREYVRRLGRGLLTRTELPKGAATVSVVAEAFLADRHQRHADGKLALGSVRDYEDAVEEFVNAVGPGLLVDDLEPGDYARVRRRWNRLGPHAMDKSVQAVRTMYRWAVKHRLIPREPFYGDAFGKSTQAEHRAQKVRRIAERGERKFSTADIRAMLKSKHLTPKLRAMILLGLNGGFYAKDCSDLLWSEIRKVGSVTLVISARAKTGVTRQCPLWTETLVSLRQMPHVSDRVFVAADGGPIVRDGDDRILDAFDTLLYHIDRDRAAKGGPPKPMRRHGVGFGALRHTHVSAVGDHPDSTAQRLVRAHKLDVIIGAYDIPPVARLKSVTDLARKRLLGK